MLTYTPPDPSKDAARSEKPWLLLLLCAVWVLTGLVGHDPWKPLEPIAASIVQGVAQDGQWLVPHLAGEPYLVRPPLYYWVAAALAALLSPWALDFHDAARLATGVFMGITLVAVGLLGRQLVAQRRGRSTALLLIGSLGLLVRAHELVPDTATLAGYCLGLLGLAMGRLSWKRGTLVLGLGWLVLLMAAGVWAASLVLLVALVLLLSPAWRVRYYGITLPLAAALACVPFLLWLTAAHQAAPGPVDAWLQREWHDAMLAWMQPQQAGAKLFYLKDLYWYAWPAWPLAVWALWSARRGIWREPWFVLPVATLVVVLPAISLQPQPRDVYGLLLLPPLCVLGAVGVDQLRRGGAAAFDWFGIMTFGLLSLLVWVGWLAIYFGYPARIAKNFAKLAPGFVDGVSITGLVLALLLMAAWAWAVARRRPDGRRALTNWAAGLTLFWGLVMTLLLPWVDHGRSYRPVVVELRHELDARRSCVIRSGLSTTLRGVLDYHGAIRTVEPAAAAAAGCHWMLSALHPGTEESFQGWKLVWRGKRPNDRTEEFRLYQRHIPGA